MAYLTTFPSVMDKLFGSSFFQIQSSFYCAYPQIVFFIFINDIYRVVRQTWGVFFIMLVIVYRQALWGQFVDSTTFGAEPDVLSIYFYTINKVTVQMVVAIWAMSKTLEIIGDRIVYVGST